MNPDALCYVGALICFILAAAGVPARIGWRDAGYAFLVLSLLV